jgi:hypothetical protein
MLGEIVEGIIAVAIFVGVLCVMGWIVNKRFKR